MKWEGQLKAAVSHENNYYLLGTGINMLCFDHGLRVHKVHVLCRPYVRLFLMVQCSSDISELRIRVLYERICVKAYVNMHTYARIYTRMSLCYAFP